MELHEGVNHDVGVIVGRFQVPDLHDGHKALFNYVLERHRKVIVVLGVAPTVNTMNNPLDIDARFKMITSEYPGIVIAWVKDIPNDDDWSQSLDNIVNTHLTPTQSAVLYGGRDSFIKVYTGKFDTHELVQKGYMSGSEVREQVRLYSEPNASFRAGVIWAAANRFPVVYTCVDIIPFTSDFKKIGLAKKKHDTGWRVIGGHADVNSPSFEHDAYREANEEAHLGFIYPLQYLGSFTVNDWRYRNEPDIIKTLLFMGVTEDMGRADDDIDEFKWFDVDCIKHKVDSLIAELHRPLVHCALDSLVDQELLTV